MIRQMLAEESEMNESGDLVGKKSKDTLISPSDKKEWSEHVAELRKTLTKLLKNLENSEDESLGDTIDAGIKNLKDWKGKIDHTLKEDDDRCTRIAKRKYDVWPSAYASGAVVKCRQGKIWKGLKEEDIATIDEMLENIEERLSEKKKTDFSKEKEQGLHGWFARQGGKGKSKGWVDCNTCRKDAKTGKKTCKSCGRKEGEKRAKYPACRPTPSACKSTGKGNSWGKKAADE